MRIRGRIERLSEFEKLSADVTRELIYRILSTTQQKTLETKRSVDLAYSLPASLASASTPSSSARRSAPRSA